MRVSAIAAMDRRGVLGNGGRMPWHLPRDLKRFRQFTLGKPIIMGRNTLLSLSSPLAGRTNIVLTRKPDFVAPGCTVVHSIEEALSAAEDHLKAAGGDETMIIGGGLVFQETLPLCDRVYLTLVEGQFTGDTYFPLPTLHQLRWRLVDRESCPADDKNPYPHQFLTLARHPENGSPEQVFDLKGEEGMESEHSSSRRWDVSSRGDNEGRTEASS
jgi:dihydrofolate reductase